MKKLMLALVAAALIAPSASAQVHVKGYVTKNGTYVAPYTRSSPNSTTLDNYSTKGNVNPYTGKAGTKEPLPQQLVELRDILPASDHSELQLPVLIQAKAAKTLIDRGWPY